MGTPERSAAEGTGIHLLRGLTMTAVLAGARTGVRATPGVYAPQNDSQLLVEVLRQNSLAEGRTVVDLWTGSGCPPRTACGPSR